MSIALCRPACWMRCSQTVYYCHNGNCVQFGIFVARALRTIAAAAVVVIVIPAAVISTTFYCCCCCCRKLLPLASCTWSPTKIALLPHRLKLCNLAHSFDHNAANAALQLAKIDISMSASVCVCEWCDRQSWLPFGELVATAIISNALLQSHSQRHTLPKALSYTLSHPLAHTYHTCIRTYSLSHLHTPNEYTRLLQQNQVNHKPSDLLCLMRLRSLVFFLLFFYVLRFLSPFVILYVISVAIFHALLSFISAAHTKLTLMILADACWHALWSTHTLAHIQVHFTLTFALFAFSTLLHLQLNRWERRKFVLLCLFSRLANYKCRLWNSTQTKVEIKCQLLVIKPFNMHLNS